MMSLVLARRTRCRGSNALKLARKVRFPCDASKQEASKLATTSHAVYGESMAVASNNMSAYLMPLSATWIHHVELS